MIISAEQIGKRYRLDHRAARGAKYGTLRDVLAGGVKRVFGRLVGGQPEATTTREDFWALRDVSFGIRQGEVLGVIGRNGAGKSTLLKLLSRITRPTEGRIRIRGRLASLLEVGTGFHPELSGRENIFLNGAILGMGVGEIRRKFDDIVAFAEIDRFLDTPVKRYSSGMYVRLAFAVAAHLDPEILIVDEVLAVGDASFQKKCLGKMSEVASAGRTVLFVSHNMSAVANLCTRGLVLERGRVVADGTVHEAMARYLSDSQTVVELGDKAVTHPTITRVELDPDALQDGDLVLRVEFDAPADFSPLVGVVLASAQGLPLFGTNAELHPGPGLRQRLRAGTATLRIPRLPLHSGTYRVSVYLGDYQQTVHDSRLDVLTIDFVSPRPLPSGLSADVIGPFQVAAEWSLEGAGSLQTRSAT